MEKMGTRSKFEITRGRRKENRYLRVSECQWDSGCELTELAGKTKTFGMSETAP
ncbi:MAG: hypothetical protein HFG34_08875 [Eubacterium sp.]|nr:hypothetical protein [Eubacterium sp.]